MMICFYLVWGLGLLQAVLVAPPRGGDAPSLLEGSAQKGNGQLGGD